MEAITPQDEHYAVPWYRLESLDEFQPTSTDPERVYAVNIGDGMELAFLVHPRPGVRGDVRVGVHSAKVPSNPDGHFFAPVQLARSSGAPYVLFSDPTLTLAPQNRLSWYLGTPDVNPDDSMEVVIRRVMQAANAPWVVMEGSSSGGFVAMRLATRFHNAIAVPKIPQTDIFRYSIRRPVLQTLRTAWAGLSHDDIMAEHAQRVRVADLYTDPRWNRGNLVMYIHNTGDHDHTEHHLTPFLAELGEEPNAHLALDGRVTVSRPYFGEGHVGVPPAHWRADAEWALARLKSLRPDAGVDEPLFSPPTHFAPTMGRQARAVTVGAHHTDV